MILSMTGYGIASLQKSGIAVMVEIRTVNHRFLDLHVRLAREYGFLETEISQHVRNTLRRGRVDISVNIQTSIPAECLININVARSYMEAAARLQRELQFENSLDLKTLLQLPGVLQGQAQLVSEQVEAGAELREFVMMGVGQALGTVQQMRQREGQALESEMKAYLDSIRSKVAAVRAQIPAAHIEYRQRLEERLKYLLPQVTPDPQRLAQEVALLVEKSDISEEITRLESHMEQYSGVLDDGREAGKKMDFLLQEMHREVNTILSKTGNLEVTRHGIAIKADIEKLREQVQNVE
jgi:uncharacterized protein (TIGR00255 family)